MAKQTEATATAAAATAVTTTPAVVIEGAEGETVNVTVEAAPAPAAPAGLSPDLLAVLAHMSAENQRTLMTAVTELKRPSEEDQRKLDDAKLRRQNNARAMMRDAQGQEQAKASRQASCSHTKGNGMTAFTGQVNSDGCWRAYCPLCHYVSPRIKAEEWQVKSGLELHKMPGRSLTIPILEAWARKTPDAEPLLTVPVGMVVDLSDAA